MDKKHWCIGSKMAEWDAVFFVELTEEEEKAVRKFIAAQDNGPDEGYSGYFDLYPHHFDSLEEAEEYVKESDNFCFSELDWRPYSDLDPYRKNNKP